MVEKREEKIQRKKQANLLKLAHGHTVLNKVTRNVRFFITKSYLLESDEVL